MILDGNLCGYYNMACDEAIFNHYPQKRVPTLRIYGWSRPFVSLGYFQKAAQVLNLDISEREKIPFVRRITGGAAILHSQEITYSLTLSTRDLNLSSSVKESYRILTSFLLMFYKKLSLHAYFAVDICNGSLGRYGNFCFSSHENFDILINGIKIGGNAQKRSKELIFQQGSIPAKLHFGAIRKVIKNIPQDLEEKSQGLFYFLGKSVDIYRLKEKAAISFKETSNVDLGNGDLSKEEKDSLRNLKKDKYASIQWNFKY